MATAFDEELDLRATFAPLDISAAFSPHARWLLLTAPSNEKTQLIQSVPNDEMRMLIQHRLMLDLSGYLHGTQSYRDALAKEMGIDPSEFVAIEDFAQRRRRLHEILLQPVGDLRATDAAAELARLVRMLSFVDGIRDPVEGGATNAVLVRRIRYESPLEIVLNVEAALVAAPAALAALIVLAKRVYGLDLELLTHREERREKFYVAKRQADLALNELLTSDPGAFAGRQHDKDAVEWTPEVRRRLQAEPERVTGALQARSLTLADHSDS